MPENDLYKFDCKTCESDSGITQDQYLGVIAKANQIFGPLITADGGTLNIVDHWDDATVNASAEEDSDQWVVNMYGGLARRPEITVDGFTFVLCHEMGHHLGGFPFMRRGFGTVWAAAEGQADYFAAHVCPALWWAGDAANAQSASAIPASAKRECDDAWKTVDDQNLCYRAAAASKSVTSLLAALGNQKISFDKHDPKVVSRTFTDHPQAQCRLDTYIAGATCAATWDTSTIPGRESGEGDNTVTGERSSSLHTCTASGQYTIGLRPTCWFKATL